MTTTAWIALLLTWAIAVASPGPDFVAVLRSGAACGRRDALLVAAGVVTGIGCWIVLALTGLALVLAAHSGLYTVLRVLGAAFLIGYGVVILWHARRQHPDSPDSPDTDHPAQPAARTPLAAYRLGLLTNLANPKALVFFGALLASLLPADTGTAVKVEVTAAMLGVAICWFGLTATLASAPRVVRGYRRAQRAIDGVLGTVFIGLGGLLLRH